MPAVPSHYAKRDLLPGEMARERPHLEQRDLRAGEDDQPAVTITEVIAAVDRRNVRVCDGEALDLGWSAPPKAASGVTPTMWNMLMEA
jgi:hypothetical protein